MNFYTLAGTAIVIPFLILFIFLFLKTGGGKKGYLCNYCHEFISELDNHYCVPRLEHISEMQNKSGFRGFDFNKYKLSIFCNACTYQNELELFSISPNSDQIIFIQHKEHKHSAKNVSIKIKDTYKRLLTP